MWIKRIYNFHEFASKPDNEAKKTEEKNKITLL